VAGAPRNAADFVFSTDEKPSIQALVRLHPSTPPGPGHPTRVEHADTYGGASVSLAALDVHRAKVFGWCEPTIGMAPADRLITQAVTQPPYREGQRVF